jgi:succinoglycan biosynthesis transport protein ExoP
MQNIYVLFVRRWWWLVLIGAVLAIGVVYNSVRNQPSLYRAQSSIQVGRTIESKNPDQGELTIIGQLVQTYAALAERDPVLVATVQTLKLPLGPGDLRARLLVTPQFNVPLIDIAVIDTDPVRAAAIANEIARQLVLQSPSSSQQDTASRTFTLNQLADLQDKITRGQGDASALQDQIATLTSATDIESARQRLTALQSQLESWQESYARLASSVEPSQTNLLTVVSTAMPSSAPVPQRNTLNYALALVLGAGLATLLALALELFNRSVTSAEELETLAVGLPIAQSRPAAGQPGN